MFRSIPLLLVLVLTTACSIVPSGVARDLFPDRTTTEFRVAESAFQQLIRRHVDKPGSQQLITAAVDAVVGAVRESNSAAVFPTEALALTGDPDGDFNKFAQRLNAILGAVPTPTGVEDHSILLERVSVDAMARSMKECHTYYLDPERAQTFNQPPQEYSGIGAQISATQADGLPQIADIFPGTPADRAGLRPGDRIRSVDGEDVSGFTAEEVANRIRGPEATTVVLVISRASGERTFPILRARVIPPRVTGRTVAEGKVGYVRVFAFNGDVTRQTAEAVENLLDQGVESMILDLRNNPGGDLAAAVDIGSIFIRGVLVKQVGRDGQVTELRTNDRWFWSRPVPLVVLVNERSASGSEIVSAGVRANNVGTVIGTRTAGCVGIGSPYTLPDGSLILITIARMLDAETGEELNGEGLGVVPDRIVPADPEAAGDPQLDAATAFLRG